MAEAGRIHRGRGSAGVPIEEGTAPSYYNCLFLFSTSFIVFFRYYFFLCYNYSSVSTRYVDLRSCDFHSIPPCHSLSLPATPCHSPSVTPRLSLFLPLYILRVVRWWFILFFLSISNYYHSNNLH